MTYRVYILASKRNGTLYVGVTNNLARRVDRQRNGTGASFTRKYGVTRLVHVQPFEDIAFAIAQEKRLKKWPRAWKLRIIERDTPGWRDLYDDITA